jgi:hypothetical protein
MLVVGPLPTWVADLLRFVMVLVVADRKLNLSGLVARLCLVPLGLLRYAAEAARELVSVVSDCACPAQLLCTVHTWPAAGCLAVRVNTAH